MTLTLVIFLIAGALVLASVYMLFASRTRVRVEHERDRMESVALTGSVVELPDEKLVFGGKWLTDRLLRAGIRPRAWHPFGLAVLVVGGALVGYAVNGVLGLLLPLPLLVVLYLYLMFRARRERERMIQQLPSFLDSMLRAVAAGRSVPNAVMAATEHSSDPLRQVLLRALRRVELGGDLAEALQEARRVYQVQELAILRMVIIIGQRYGGNVKDILTSVARIIRDREQDRREVKALTGEVRLTAWILGLLPVGLALYIIAVNRAYLLSMWEDPTGQMLLIGVGVMQVVAALALWRMVKTVA